jgi:hypothetical protein
MNKPAKVEQASKASSTVRFKNKGDGVVAVEGTDEALEQTFGSRDAVFSKGLAMQMIGIGGQGKEIDEDGSAFIASIVRGIAPRDEIEAMLAMQMAAVHNATMTFADRLAHVENIPQQDSAERAFNKLTRTFASQMEALRKYRTGGQQNVTVKHVTVNEGGQAVVGNVSHGGEGDRKK